MLGVMQALSGDYQTNARYSKDHPKADKPRHEIEYYQYLILKNLYFPACYDQRSYCLWSVAENYFQEEGIVQVVDKRKILVSCFQEEGIVQIVDKTKILENHSQEVGNVLVRIADKGTEMNHTENYHDVEE